MYMMGKIKKTKDRYIKKNITITEEQEEWITLNWINLSRFVQDKLEEVMKK